MILLSSFAVTTAKPVLLVVLSRSHVHLLQNFLQAPAVRLGALASWEPYLLCADADTGPLVSRVGWRCNETAAPAPSNGAVTAEKVYTSRIRTLARLVDARRDVLLCDTDALWLSDPWPHLRGVDAGIVGSRAGYPFKALGAWGATFCMGFIFFRGSEPSVRALLPAVLHPMREDQTDFNNNLARAGVSWDGGRVPYSPSTAVDYGTVTAEWVGHMTKERRATAEQYRGVRVALLPEAHFKRLCSSRDALQGAVVAHCASRSHGGALKAKFLEKRGLWWMAPVVAWAGPRSSAGDYAFMNADDQ